MGKCLNAENEGDSKLWMHNLGKLQEHGFVWLSIGLIGARISIRARSKLTGIDWSCEYEHFALALSLWIRTLCAAWKQDEYTQK